MTDRSFVLIASTKTQFFRFKYITVMKQKLLFAFLMGMITTGLVSFTLISINVGFGDRFLGIWLKSWSIAMIPALFSILFISPKVLWALKKFQK